MTRATGHDATYSIVVDLPRAATSGATVVEYAPLQFPLRPLQLIEVNSQGLVRTEAVGDLWVDWLKQIEAERSHYAKRFFAAAGYSDPDERSEVERMAAFDLWLRGWVLQVFQPSFGRYWFYGVDPTGAPGFAAWDSAGYDPELERVQISIAIDIALVVLDEARKVCPLRWVLSRETFGSMDPVSGFAPLSLLPTVEPGSPSLYPISEAHGLMLRALVRPGSRAALKLDRLHGLGWTSLGALYQALLDGTTAEFPSSEAL